MHMYFNFQLCIVPIHTCRMIVMSTQNKSNCIRYINLTITHPHPQNTAQIQCIAELLDLAQQVTERPTSHGMGSIGADFSFLAKNFYFLSTELPFINLKFWGVFLEPFQFFVQNLHFVRAEFPFLSAEV